MSQGFSPTAHALLLAVLPTLRLGLGQSSGLGRARSACGAEKGSENTRKGLCTPSLLDYFVPRRG